MPVQRPYNPNSRRIAEMIQSDWAKVGVKAKIVSYEWGEYLSGIRKGEHDTALYGWMSDNGDPDNFADVLLSCDSIQSGSNAARWCDKNTPRLSIRRSASARLRNALNFMYRRRRSSTSRHRGCRSPMAAPSTRPAVT